MDRTLELSVNGRSRTLVLDPERSLLSVLRDELGLTGAKDGCGEGACGACTVLVDGRAVRSCTVPIREVTDRPVVTVEGLAGPDDQAEPVSLHPVQRAFVEEAALQCGYCTPGMVMAAVGLLDEHPAPTDEQIRRALDGNVCRCGAHERILRAVRRAAASREQAGTPGAPSGSPGPFRDRPDRGLELAGTLDVGSTPWDLAAPEHRDYFKLLGNGVVGLVEPPTAGPEWRGLRPSGAWIHVGSNGQVTAFTGKVEVGQGTRTALSELAARELRVPLDTVGLVMGDTDVCPYDPGTFGSRSMPDAGPAMRAAAAAALDAIRRLASDEWEVSAEDLVADDGRVTTRDGARTASYAELVRDARLIVAGDPDTLAAAPGSSAGEDASAGPARPAQVVSGRRRYASDIYRPEMLHGRVLRPPSANATLRSVDLTAARAQPGVIALAEDGFVAVAAPDRATASRALGAIRAEWDPAPQVAEDELETYLRSHPVESQGWGGGFEHTEGDPEAGLRASDVTLAGTYRTAYVAHVPAETRAAVAEWRGDRVIIWTGSQRPFAIRAEVAGALHLPETAVRVIVGPTGAAFGGKHDAQVSIEAARLARAAHQAVRVKWTRAGEFTAGYLRPTALIDVRSGASRSGKLRAWTMTTFNAGPNAIRPPYAAAHQAIRFQPTATPFRQGAYRALAATANTFARESHIDELARRLRQDPLEFRLRNLPDERLADVLRAAAEAVDWAARPRPDGHGLGLACGLEKDGRVATAVEVRAVPGEPLEILRIVTAFDCGAIVDRDAVTAQVAGATTMGLGPALVEAIHFADGRITNGRLADYPLPRFTMIPPISVVLIDRPDQPSAGAGETPLIALAPAIANAIDDACGLRLRALPLVPDGRLPDRPEGGS
jgi:CO/xanthine dehydrogenase Mo-binding subunit/aerobic-type carbon monoxide dehydrogenase small subunit (CoxS/CutS family)